MADRPDERRAKDLWGRYRDRDDRAARDDLIVMYAPLVRYVASRMRSALPSHVEEADLISYGLVGLMDAVDRFDPHRGVKFETFAATRVRGSIIDELRSMDWVPRHVRALAKRIERTAAELEARLQRAPTDHELADALHMEEEDLLAAVALISTTSLVALDEMWSLSAGGESVPLIDMVADRNPTDPEAIAEDQERREKLVGAISRLPKRERIVVSLYYYGGLTLKEIAEVLGVSETRARQMNATAILRLKGRLGEGTDDDPDAPDVAIESPLNTSGTIGEAGDPLVMPRTVDRGEEGLWITDPEEEA